MTTALHGSHFRGVPAALLAGLVAFLASTFSLAEEPSDPGEIAGLVARYTAESLHARHADGSPVTAWKDTSGNGHDLTATTGGVQALFHIQQLNEKPAVEIRRGMSFLVADPFELGDHTIFLVYRSEYTQRALFRSDTDDSRGLILRAGDDRYHKFQNGPNALSVYNEATPLGKEFSITVLFRASGRLGCRINGADVSSGAEFADTVRVGEFFKLKHSQQARSDAHGVRIAEMLFYDRFLPLSESDAVTRQLSERYGIEVKIPKASPQPERTRPKITWDRASARIWLTTTEKIDVNEGRVFVPWDGEDKAMEPFRHGADDENTRLFCMRDGIRAELFVRLPVTTSKEGAVVRVLLLKNGEEYVGDDAVSGPIRGDGETKHGVIELLTLVEMNAGDFLEVVASRDGPAGEVLLDPAEAVFGANMK